MCIVWGGVPRRDRLLTAAFYLVASTYWQEAALKFDFGENTRARRSAEYSGSSAKAVFRLVVDLKVAVRVERSDATCLPKKILLPLIYCVLRLISVVLI